MIIKKWDNVLSESLMEAVSSELNSIEWEKHFTRAGSDMQEASDRSKLPVLNSLYEMFSIPIFLEHFEKILGVEGLLPDPYMMGAGYSQIKNCGDLKPHVDFNWNAKLKLYRVATFIIYLNDVESGGEIEFIGVEKIPIKKNRAILFEHSETIRHFVHPVVGIRKAVRFFYYASKLKDPDNKHRSLYGYVDGKYTDISQP
jgi:hypothetical protein